MTALMNWRVWAALALAAVLAFTHFTAYKSGKANVQAKWDAEKVVQLNQAKEDEIENRRIDSARQRNVIDAQSAATKRNTDLQADAATSRAAVDGLRNFLRANAAALPGRSDDAAGKYAAAANELLAICAGRYQDMAATADAHNSDSLMYQSAWPK